MLWVEVNGPSVHLKVKQARWPVLENIQLLTFQWKILCIWKLEFKHLLVLYYGTKYPISTLSLIALNM